MMSSCSGPDKYQSSCLTSAPTLKQAHPPTITARVGVNEYYCTYERDSARFMKNKFKAARKKGLNPFVSRSSQAS